MDMRTFFFIRCADLYRCEIKEERGVEKKKKKKSRDQQDNDISDVFTL